MNCNDQQHCFAEVEARNLQTSDVESVCIELQCSPWPGSLNLVRSIEGTSTVSPACHQGQSDWTAEDVHPSDDIVLQVCIECVSTALRCLELP